MRGKPVPAQIPRARPGITPAHAGKTRRQRGRRESGGDHPRACGENSHSVLPSASVLGSPPRIRGKHDAEGRARQVPGITPAHAGKTFTFKAFFRISRDHPRACGENGDLSAFESDLTGSPPRMRGKHFGKGVFPWLILVLSLDPL